jgi:hypothetical protein
LRVLVEKSGSFGAVVGELEKVVYGWLLRKELVSVSELGNIPSAFLVGCFTGTFVLIP